MKIKYIFLEILHSILRRIKNILHIINAFIANLYYRFPARKLCVIGITGTDGKTTTTHLVYEILKKDHKKVSMLSTIKAYIGNEVYDTGLHVTTPNPWFLQKMMAKAVASQTSYFVLEVTSHSIDQHRIWGIPFYAGVLTNISREHLDYHKSYKRYVSVKCSLLRRAQWIVLNREDKSYFLVRKKIYKKKNITYGMKIGDVTWKDLSISIRLPGDYNKYNALAAYAVCVYILGIDKSSVNRTLSQAKPISGRYNKIKTKYGFDVIIDFAHTPNALYQVLSTIKHAYKRKIIHVFGCAGERDKGKRKEMGKISAKYADISIITEEDYRTEDFNIIVQQIRSGMKRTHKVFVYKYRQDAINYATSVAKRGDVIVLTGKGHERSLCRGKKEYLWDEKEAVIKALNNLS